MPKPLLLTGAAWLLLHLSAHAQSSSAPDAPTTDAPALQARITRVERGLSTPVVVRGAPAQKMSLTERMAFYKVPAVSIALINDGRVEWARAYGMADVARQQPATVQTLFQAGSVSKALSAIGALRLVEQGRLALDEDVNRRLTSWQIPPSDSARGQTVSLRRLLNHSAGLTVHGYHGYARGQALPTLVQVLNGTPPANAEPVRIDVTPGSLWRYSGGGYSVVQLLVTEATGQPFDRYMQTAVFNRLGMRQSTFAAPLPRNRQRLAATAYDGNGQALAGRWHTYPESAAAGLWTTPSDLARVVLAVQQAEAGQSDQLLSRPMASTMLTRGLGEYGLGFYVENLGKTTSFSHSGGTEGFRAQLYGYTRSGQGVVVLTNSDNGAALIGELLSSIATEYGWPEFRAIEKTALPANVATNHLVAGDYQLLDKPAHVVAEGPRLYFQCDLFGAQRLELFPESETRFFVTTQDITLQFERGPDGAILGFSLLRGPNTYPAKRIR